MKHARHFAATGAIIDRQCRSACGKRTFARQCGWHGIAGESTQVPLLWSEKNTNFPSTGSLKA
jgi:hypothetical protein